MLTVTFAGGSIRRDGLAPFGDVVEFSPSKAVLKIPRDRVKAVASGILSSSLPADDILISEMSVDDVVRIIFEKQKSA
jgi:hypothetical protein